MNLFAQVAWPALGFSMSVVLISAVAVVLGAKAVAREEARERRGWALPVVLLVCGLVFLAGLLLALWSLDLAGNLGR